MLPRSRRAAYVVPRAGLRAPWPVAIVLWLTGQLHGTPPEVPATTPTPTPVATTARTPVPPVPRHAPDGVFYLLEDTIVPLEHGIQGVPAGTEVKLIKDNGNTVEISAGECRFTMKKTQLTDDLDIAAAVQKRAASADSANEETLRKQEEVLVKQQRDEIEFLRAHPLSTPTPTPGK